MPFVVELGATVTLVTRYHETTFDDPLPAVVGPRASLSCGTMETRVRQETTDDD